MSVDGINFLFKIGGDDKKNSSSSILKKWQNYHEERIWGAFYNLFESDDVKVKELIVDPGKGMSFQKHFKRFREIADKVGAYFLVDCAFAARLEGLSRTRHCYRAVFARRCEHGKSMDV